MKQDLVLDCSITMAWCFSDESSKKADKVLTHLVAGDTAHVPNLWALEVSNILAVGEKRKRISAAGISYFLERLQKLPIEMGVATSAYAFTNILNLSREYKISSYDAAYLDLAMRLGAPLATQDKQLLAVAKSAKVELFH
jgi:predicted nucleic acid-binding protein